MKYYRTLLFAASFAAVMLVMGHGLNPFDAGMFDFHDETQAARVTEFAESLRHVQIPPRIAPHFSFGMGYPVFNFYAPTAYWVTGGMNLAGIPAKSALKISLIAAMVVGFTGAYLLFMKFSSEGAALMGAMLYVSSLYVAVDIFVRGNLSEIWFIGLFPLALFVLTESKVLTSRRFFIFACITVAALLGAHNLLSLLAVPLLLTYAAVIGRFRAGLLLICIGLAVNAYFFIPLFGESHLTYASEVAKSTHYGDHFLCAAQLWQSAWGYGGSAPGCDADGISFKVGKPQLILFMLAIAGAVAALMRGKHRRREPLAFFTILAVGALFLTTYWSKPLWDLLAPVSAIIQFPWRFIALSLVGVSAVPALMWDMLPGFKIKDVFAVIVGLVVLASVYKYFQKNEIAPNEYYTRYESSNYIARRVAFRVSEYLPRTADYGKWKSLDTDPLPKHYGFTYNNGAETEPRDAVLKDTGDGFSKSVTLAKDAVVKLNIHYMPYWRIMTNGAEVTPGTFDYLGRPVLRAKAGDTVSAIYRQSPVEVTGDIITFIAMALIAVSVAYTPIWKRISSLKA